MPELILIYKKDDWQESLPGYLKLLGDIPEVFVVDTTAGPAILVQVSEEAYNEELCQRLRQASVEFIDENSDAWKHARGRPASADGQHVFS